MSLLVLNIAVFYPSLYGLKNQQQTSYFFGTGSSSLISRNLQIKVWTYISAHLSSTVIQSVKMRYVAEQWRGYYTVTEVLYISSLNRNSA